MYVVLEIRGHWLEMPIQKKRWPFFSYMMTSLTGNISYFLLSGKWNVMVSCADSFLFEPMEICRSLIMLLTFYTIFLFYILLLLRNFGGTWKIMWTWAMENNYRSLKCKIVSMLSEFLYFVMYRNEPYKDFKSLRAGFLFYSAVFGIVWISTVISSPV